MKQHLMGLMLLASLVVPASARAQVPVVGVADPESLFSDSDAQLHANKQVGLRYTF